MKLAVSQKRDDWISEMRAVKMVAYDFMQLSNDIYHSVTTQPTVHECHSLFLRPLLVDKISEFHTKQQSPIKYKREREKGHHTGLSHNFFNHQGLQIFVHVVCKSTNAQQDTVVPVILLSSLREWSKIFKMWVEKTRKTWRTARSVSL